MWRNTSIFDDLRQLAFTPSFDPTGQFGWQPIQNKLNSYADHSLASALNGGQWHDWDGVTKFPLFFPSTYTEEQAIQHRKDWYEYVFPETTTTGNYSIRGLRELYEWFQPFADPSAPTVVEFERFSNLVLNHFRYISGLDPAYPNKDLYAQVTWSEERKKTSYWDTIDPGVFDSAYGRCIGGTNIHCGATFVPPEALVGSSYGVIPSQVSTWSQVEAILTDYNGSALMKMSRNLRQYMLYARDGIQLGGHALPFLFREKYGMGLTRSKWAGAIQSPPPGYTY